MAGRAVYGSDYYEDIKILQRRGWTAERIARHYGMSRATVYRVLKRGRD